MDKKEIAKLKKDLLKNKSHDIYKNVQALFDLAYATNDKDLNLTVRKICAEKSQKFKKDRPEHAEKYRQLYKNTLLFAAPYDFDSFCRYIEWNREPSKRFYLPRRKQLKVVVDALQDLADDKLDLLAVSMPPGVGKTTIAIFYLAWMGGRVPNLPMLGGSHSNSFLRGVYDEILRVVDENGEYLWHDVFPSVDICNTNAKDMRIDLDKPQRFETFEFSSIGSGNAGKVRAGTLLYCDDLVDGIETAMSKERLDKLWQQYTTDLRQRKIGNCKELHIATRWSVHDVIGRLEQQYGDSERAKFIVIPALDSEEQSNFDYGGDIGFTTEFYHEQREIMDDVSWRALYMNQPIEREGLLYAENELRRYFELPDTEPDGIISICDTKDRGKDYAFMPVAYIYGKDYYIADCVCDNSLPNIVEPRIVNCLLKNKVQMARFEHNNAGGRIAKDIQEEIKKLGGITKITTKFTTSNKETKIIVNSAYVKEHFLFKDSSLYKKKDDYGKMIDFLCSYTVTGKNKHDDVPDGMAMLSEYAQSFHTNKVEVFSRPF
jgi:predicted phage terminase large subunit-like protein